MAKSSTKAKASIKKVGTPLTNIEARQIVLGSIRKPYKSAKKEQRKYFTEFLARLEERDKNLEKTDLEKVSEEAMNHVFSEKKENMFLEWEVEEVLDASTIEGKLHFMVLWAGHLLEDCTWEAETDMENARDAIDDFYAAFPHKTRGPSKKAVVRVASSRRTGRVSRR